MIKNTFMTKKSVTYNGNRYSIYEDILDWEQAERNCEELGGHLATCIIKVKERKATKVKLSRKSLTLKVGRKYALKATVYPKNTTDTKKWTINKKGIVKVSSKGVVTGLKKGKCKITLKTSSGKSAYCVM